MSQDQPAEAKSKLTKGQSQLMLRLFLKGLVAKKRAVDAAQREKDIAEGKEVAEFESPWVPTSQLAVDEFLKLTKVTPADTVLDLGCGDGRVPLTAAQLGAKGIGIDNDPQILDRAVKARDGLDPDAQTRVELIEASVDSEVALDAIKRSTVVFLFMMPKVNEYLKRVVFKHLPVGARVCTYTFKLTPLQPVESVPIKSGATSLHLYEVTPETKAAIAALGDL